jgi:hypothetical protein
MRGQPTRHGSDEQHRQRNGQDPGQQQAMVQNVRSVVHLGDPILCVVNWHQALSRSRVA